MPRLLTVASLDLKPLIQPRQNLVVPEQRVIRLRAPMVLVGKVDELRRDAATLKKVECANARSLGDAEVLAALDDELGSLEVCRIGGRGPLAVVLQSSGIIRRTLQGALT
jgi:hypothetical protein